MEWWVKCVDIMFWNLLCLTTGVKHSCFIIYTSRVQCWGATNLTVKFQLCSQHQNDLSRSTTKTTKWPLQPTKTQISLAIHPVLSKALLSAWRMLESLTTQMSTKWRLDQTGQMPSWAQSLLGAQIILLCCGSLHWFTSSLMFLLSWMQYFSRLLLNGALKVSHASIKTLSAQCYRTAP